MLIMTGRFVTRRQIAAHLSAVGDFYRNGYNNNLNGDQFGSVVVVFLDWSESVAV